MWLRNIARKWQAWRHDKSCWHKHQRWNGMCIGMACFSWHRHWYVDKKYMSWWALALAVACVYAMYALENINMLYALAYHEKWLMVHAWVLNDGIVVWIQVLLVGICVYRLGWVEASCTYTMWEGSRQTIGMVLDINACWGAKKCTKQCYM